MNIVRNIICFIRKDVLDYMKKKSKGSITVEAAFVMPIVAFTVFALIYLAFFLHDYNRIVSTVDLVAYKAGIAGKHEADIATGRTNYENINDRGVFYLLTGDARAEELQIIKLLEQELSKGLFICKISKTEVKAGKQEVNINVQAKAEINLPMFKDLLDRMFMIRLDSSYPIHNPAEAIRVWEVILDTGSKIKSVNKLKEAIEKYIK
jgi:hypothetical protein